MFIQIPAPNKAELSHSVEQLNHEQFAVLLVNTFQGTEDLKTDARTTSIRNAEDGVVDLGEEGQYEGRKAEKVEMNHVEVVEFSSIKLSSFELALGNQPC
jgi:hypothetical protein